MSDALILSGERLIVAVTGPMEVGQEERWALVVAIFGLSAPVQKTQ